MLLTSIVATSATPNTLTTPATRYIVPLYDSDRRSASVAAPIVDLGYDRYQGYYDSEFGLNVFKGCAATAKSLPSTM